MGHCRRQRFKFCFRFHCNYFHYIRRLFRNFGTKIWSKLFASRPSARFLIKKMCARISYNVNQELKFLFLIYGCHQGLIFHVDIAKKLQFTVVIYLLLTRLLRQLMISNIVKSRVPMGMKTLYTHFLSGKLCLFFPSRNGSYLLTRSKARL